MPPKNDFNLGKGRLYVPTPEGERPLGGLYTVEDIEWEEPTPWPRENPYIAIKSTQPATLTCTISVTWRNQLYKLVQYTMKLAEMLRTARRLAHLARYGKNRRIRKKNMHRLARLHVKT